jgi:hypothetical protein
MCAAAKSGGIGNARVSGQWQAALCIQGIRPAPGQHSHIHQVPRLSKFWAIVDMIVLDHVLE